MVSIAFDFPLAELIVHLIFATDFLARLKLQLEVLSCYILQTDTYSDSEAWIGLCSQYSFWQKAGEPSSGWKLRMIKIDPDFTVTVTNWLPKALQQHKGNKLAKGKWAGKIYIFPHQDSNSPSFVVYNDLISSHMACAAQWQPRSQLSLQAAILFQSFSVSSTHLIHNHLHSLYNPIK